MMSLSMSNIWDVELSSSNYRPVKVTKVDCVSLFMVQTGVQVLEELKMTVEVVLLTDRVQYFFKLISMYI